MTTSTVSKASTSRRFHSRDLLSGLLVFLVALPLCLGVAKASDAPLFSGILAGIVGGLVVGCLSGSHTSVSGPAAGLTAVVALQIQKLGSFEAFLVAVILGGVIQLVLGVIRAGSLAEYFPVSVIKGLLAAIGLILILKQIPHLFGHDSDPEGALSFVQPDNVHGRKSPPPTDAVSWGLGPGRLVRPSWRWRYCSEMSTALWLSGLRCVSQPAWSGEKR